MTAAGGAPSSVTATVVFTDIVASTEMLARLGGDATRAVRTVHDHLIEEAVAQHSGRVVKSLGDGLMLAFDAARDAVGAAIEIQQAITDHSTREPSHALEVRVGISAGDVVWRDDQADYFGTAVVEAARLCAAAQGGEILVTELVTLLSRDAGTPTQLVGDLELKGLAAPVRTHRVLWAPRTGGAVPLPPALVSALASTTFVGRTDVRARLSSTWQSVTTGGGQAVLLAGEPGVGKTRTAAELAAEAHAGGALVLHGWCEEGVAAAYQPFTQALDQHTWHLRRPPLGRQPGELRRLLPELGERIPVLPEPLTSDPRAEEYVLVDAVASWLLDASRPTGLVLVLDDLHWADRPTLLMLGHLLRTATTDADARLLVLGTYRDSDVDRHHPLADLIGEVSRLHGVERIPMRGLSVAEVLALAEATAGHSLGETGISLAETLHVQTEGNPFFVEELLAHLRETGALRSQEGRWLLSDSARGAIPVGVRDVVGRRLSRLSPEAGRALTHAAVVGRDFDVPLLARLLDTDEDVLVDTIDEAVTARLVEEVGADRFRFRHALVQETLYEEASATRRRRLHRRVAEAVEALRPDDVIALAHHFELGGPDDRRMSRAVEYGIAAAWQAYRSRALADAELRFRRVLEMLEEDPEDPMALEAMIGLGECQRDLGDQGYRETLLAAAERATGAPDKLVAAVLANRRSITSIVGEVDSRRVELAERALAVVGEHDTADRARLLGYLAAETVFTRDQTSRLALVDEAEAIARRLGDRRLLGEVLARTAFPAIAFDRLASITARGEESIALADELGDLTLRVEARGMHAWALLTAGDIAGAHEVSLEAAAIADERTPPTLRWMTQYWLVAHEGLAARFANARAMNDELLRFGDTHGEPDRLNWWAAASTAVLLLTAEIGAMAEVIGAYADQYPALPTWRAAHVQALAQAGRTADARAVLEQHPMSLKRMVEDPYGLVGIASLAQTAWLLDFAELADAVARAARPFDGQWAHLFIGVVGPVSWSIGLCDVVTGRIDEGIDRLIREVAAAEAKGCTAVAARIRADLVLALRRRNQPGDADAAAREAAAVLDVATSAGAPQLAALVGDAPPAQVAG